MICEQCGKDKPDVTTCIDPYYQEILNQEVEINLCDMCYQHSCEDI